MNVAMDTTEPISDPLEVLRRKFQEKTASNSELESLAKRLLYELHEYQEAINVLKVAISSRPKCSAAWADLGVAYSELDELDEAEHSFREALALKREVPTLVLLGVVLHKTDRDQEALQHFEEAISLEPNFDEAYYNAGLVHKGRRMYGEARRCFETALELDPLHADAHSELGICLLRAKEYEAAESHFREAIRLRHEFMWPHLYLGNLLWQRNRLVEAEQQYQLTLGLFPEEPIAHKSYGDFLQSNARGDEAAKEFAKARELEKAV